MLSTMRSSPRFSTPTGRTRSGAVFVKNSDPYAALDEAWKRAKKPAVASVVVSQQTLEEEQNMMWDSDVNDGHFSFGSLSDWGFGSPGYMQCKVYSKSVNQLKGYYHGKLRTDHKDMPCQVYKLVGAELDPGRKTMHSTAIVHVVGVDYEGAHTFEELYGPNAKYVPHCAKLHRNGADNFFKNCVPIHRDYAKAKLGKYFASVDSFNEWPDGSITLCMVPSE